MTGPDGDLSSPALPGNTGAGSEKKRKKAVFDPLSKRWMCSECQRSNAPSSDQRQFGSRQAACGHMQVHTRMTKQQAEGRASLSESRKKKGKEEVPCARKQSKSHRASFVPMRVDNNKPQRQVQHAHGEKEKEPARNFLKFWHYNSNKMKAHSSLLAAEDARRKEKHWKIDLNNPPVDDENDDGKGA